MVENPRVGQRFRRREDENEDENEYILARVKRNQLALINLRNGNRWADPVEVDEELWCGQGWVLSLDQQKSIFANDKGFKWRLS